MFPRTSSALSGRIAGIIARTRRGGVQGTRSRASQYTATTTRPTTTAQATKTATAYHLSGNTFTISAVIIRGTRCWYPAYPSTRTFHGPYIVASRRNRPKSSAQTYSYRAEGTRRKLTPTPKTNRTTIVSGVRNHENLYHTNGLTNRDRRNRADTVLNTGQAYYTSES